MVGTLQNILRFSFLYCWNVPSTEGNLEVNEQREKSYVEDFPVTMSTINRVVLEWFWHKVELENINQELVEGNPLSKSYAL